MLVGNKCDVHENHRAVPKERGQKVCSCLNNNNKVCHKSLAGEALVFVNIHKYIMYLIDGDLRTRHQVQIYIGRTTIGVQPV